MPSGIIFLSTLKFMDDLCDIVNTYFSHYTKCCLFPTNKIQATSSLCWNYLTTGVQHDPRAWGGASGRMSLERLSLFKQIATWLQS